MAHMTAGFGDFDLSCPSNPEGDEHEWVSAVVDGSRPCKHCGIVGRSDAREPGESFMDQATAARSAFFSTLRAPASAHGIKAKAKR
jgi:hypothetical protein